MQILKYLWERRTTVLGYIVTVLGVLATSDKFTESTVEWFVLIIGVITALLGHHNNAQIKKQAASPSPEGGFVRLGLLAMLIGVISLVLAACTSFVVRSYDQKVMAGYASVALINDTAATLKNASVITLGDAQEVQRKTREALAGIDTAAKLTPELGQGQLADALALLKTAQDLICSSRPQEPNCAYLTQRTQL